MENEAHRLWKMWFGESNDSLRGDCVPRANTRIYQGFRFAPHKNAPTPKRAPTKRKRVDHGAWIAAFKAHNAKPVAMKYLNSFARRQLGAN